MSMTPDDFAKISDAFDGVIELAQGFRQKLLDADFSAETAEIGVQEFLRMMMRNQTQEKT